MTNMAQQASNRAASFDSEALPAFDEKRQSMSSESIVASELSVEKWEMPHMRNTSICGRIIEWREKEAKCEVHKYFLSTLESDCTL